MTVARAAPAAPMPIQPVNRKSPMTLTMQARPMKMTGVRESPIPRKIPLTPLYPVINGSPQEQMKI